MKHAFASVLGAGTIVATLASFAGPSAAQQTPKDTGVSTPLISRCAGKFGATLRGGDQAFPLFSLDGFPWVKVEHTEKTVSGMAIAETVTGTGVQQRRRGETVSFRFTCLVDAKGEAVSFDATDLLPERKEALPPATLLRGAAFYRPEMQLPRGAELRVQLLDVAHNPAGGLLAEVVVRSSWVQPMPFVLRLPTDTKLDDRKLQVVARLGLGSRTLRQLKQPQPVAVGDLQKPLVLMLDAPDSRAN